MAMLPDFIIAGAEKCGTTSLYHYLRQHPSVFMCTPKEPDYFSRKGNIHTQELYEALFTKVAGEKAVGEASVGYLHSPEAPVRIKEVIPKARLIVVLRNPADRAYSHYNMMVSHGAVPNRPYLSVLREARREGKYHNTGIPTSRYAAPLQRYLDLFGKEQLRIYFFDEFKNDPLATTRSIFKYLGVDSTFEPEVQRHYNKTHLPRNSRLHRFIWNPNVTKRTAKALLPKSLRRKASGMLHRANRSSIPPLSPKARSFITDILLEDIEEIEWLLGCDLSAWKQGTRREKSHAPTAKAPQ